MDTDNDFENAKKLVEETIAKLGLDPATTRASSTDAQSAWTLKRGSASVLVTVTRHPDQNDETFLRVASPVVTIPADKAQHGALFRRLLEINAGGLANAAFGIVGERVVVVSERPAEGLGSAEVEQTVRHLAAVADTFDDRLQKEFGAQKA